MNPEEQLILQRNLARFVISEVFNTVTEEDILKKTEEGVMHKGVHLTEGQVNVLKKEAKQFSDSNLYKVLMDELNWHARSKLNEAKTENDMIAAKLLSYFCDAVRSKVNKIANL